MMRHQRLRVLKSPVSFVLCEQACRRLGRSAVLPSLVGAVDDRRNAVTSSGTLVMMAAMPSRVGPSGRSMFDSTVEATQLCSLCVPVGQHFLQAKPLGSLPSGGEQTDRAAPAPLR